MANQEKISIILESFFKDKGFKDFQSEIGKTQLFASKASKVMASVFEKKKATAFKLELQKINKQLKTNFRVNSNTNDIANSKMLVEYIEQAEKKKQQVFKETYQKQLAYNKRVRESSLNMMKGLRDGHIQNANKVLKNQKDLEKLSLSYKKKGEKAFNNLHSKAIQENQELNKKAFDDEKTQITKLNSKLKEKHKNTKKLNDLIEKDKIKTIKLNKKLGEQKQAKPKKSLFDFSRSMGALSILFAAQAISMALQRMATLSVQSFMKITQGQTEAGKGMTALAANMEYLKFTFGNAIATALLPFIPAITNIIQKVGDFIQKHPKLVTMGFAFMWIFTKVTLLNAQIILLLSGIQNLTGASIATSLTNLSKRFSNIGVYVGEIPGKISNIGTSITTLATKNPVLFGIYAALLLIGIAAGLSLNNLRKYPDELQYVKDAFSTMKTSLLNSMTDIGNALVSLFTDKKFSSEDWAKVTALSLGTLFKGWALWIRIISTGVIGVIEHLKNLLNIVITIAKAIATLANPLTSWSEKWTSLKSIMSEGMGNLSLSGTMDSFNKALNEGVTLAGDFKTKFNEITQPDITQNKQSGFALLAQGPQSMGLTPLISEVQEIDFTSQSTQVGELKNSFMSLSNELTTTVNDSITTNAQSQNLMSEGINAVAISMEESKDTRDLYIIDQETEAEVNKKNGDSVKYLRKEYEKLEQQRNNSARTYSSFVQDYSSSNTTER